MSQFSFNYWIFDLDNTLYPPSSLVMKQVGQRIRSFIQQYLDVDMVIAARLQEEYKKKYGTSLRGLMLHHQISADEFLEYVHQVDLVALKTNQELADIIRKLPGNKYIFTNSTIKHANNVLAKLDLNNCFDGIFDVRCAGYIPKPQDEAYQEFIRHYGIKAEEAVFFEDTAINLIPAAAFGMTTVLVAPESSRQNLIPYIHYHMSDVTDGLKQILNQS